MTSFGVFVSALYIFVCLSPLLFSLLYYFFPSLARRHILCYLLLQIANLGIASCKKMQQPEHALKTKALAWLGRQSSGVHLADFKASSCLLLPLLDKKKGDPLSHQQLQQHPCSRIKVPLLPRPENIASYSFAKTLETIKNQ